MTLTHCPHCGEPWDGHLTVCRPMPLFRHQLYGEATTVPAPECPSCALLRAEVADLTRHAEAMLAMQDRYMRGVTIQPHEAAHVAALRNAVERAKVREP